MTEKVKCALIIFPQSNDSFNYNMQFVGLTVLERLLIILGVEGIEKAAFIGDGQVPEFDHPMIKLEKVSIDKKPQGDFLLLPADVVFDKAILKDTGKLDGSLPIRRMSTDRWFEITEDPKKWLLKSGKGGADSKDGYAIRITDFQSYKSARRAIMNSLKKPMDGYVSRYLNRPISLFVSRYLVNTGLKPNPLTFVIMLMGVLSGVFAAFPQYWWALMAAGFLFQFQSVMDGCDGEIARLTYRFSLKGQWLDTLGDDITNYAFCLGIAVGQAGITGLWWWYLAGGIVFVVQWYASIIMYQRIYKMGSGDLLDMPNFVSKREPGGTWGRIVKFIHIMTKRDTFVFFTAILTAVGFPVCSFVIITIGSFIMASGLTLNEIRIRKAEKEGVKFNLQRG